MAEHSLNVTYASATLSDLKLFASQSENALRKARRRTKHALKYSGSSRASRRFFGPSISDYSIQHAERTEIRPEPVWNLTIVLDGEY